MIQVLQFGILVLKVEATSPGSGECFFQIPDSDFKHFWIWSCDLVNLDWEKITDPDNGKNVFFYNFLNLYDKGCKLKCDFFYFGS